MPQRRTVLYLSADGILKGLGYSQIARVVQGLTDRGFDYELVTAERPTDLVDRVRVDEVDRELRAHGIRWSRVEWRTGSARAAASNMRRFFRVAYERCRASRVGLVHARAYHAASVAWPLARRFRLPYLFDARGYWIDERLDESRWFHRPYVLRCARAVERRLYCDAAAIVTLTRLQQDDLENGRLGFACRVPVTTIPTCADYEVFHPDLEHSPGPWDDVWRQVAQRQVVSLVGSINASYRTDESLDLARRILTRSDQTFLLILTGQEDAFRQRIDGMSVDRERIAIRQAQHSHMPQWLRRVDWALSLLNSPPAKRASMPTKLAELFAAGVRPVHHGCNEEVTSWVRRAGSGYVLDRLNDSTMDACAAHIAESPRSPDELGLARERTRAHFALDTGLDRYGEILQRLGIEPTTVRSESRNQERRATDTSDSGTAGIVG